ncbi:hypothetical protein ACROYT_G015232 [Oculina patagonica]
MLELNPAFSSISGNPFIGNDESSEELSEESEEESEEESDGEWLESSSSDSDNDFEFREDIKLEDLPDSEVEISDSATLAALDLNLDLSDESPHLPTPVEETINVENQPPSSEVELSDSATL